jgi:hypothetical protein
VGHYVLGECIVHSEYSVRVQSIVRTVCEYSV